MQLAQRIRIAVRMGAGNADDPFGKVKTLIKEMIESLEKEASAEASHKEFCDKEMAKTDLKKAELEDTIEKFSAKIDQTTARIGVLKGEVATIQSELAALAKAQAEMDALREKEHEAYVKNRKELQEGIEGLQMALKVLRDYYDAQDNDAHGKASGAASGIIGLLETAESDFSQNL